MWMLLSVPILMIACGGALALYGIIVAASKGLKILVIVFFIIIYLIIAIILLCILIIPYTKFKTKGAKIIYSLCITILLGLALKVYMSKLELTDISVINESKNEIITDVKMISLDNNFLADEKKIFNPRTKAYTIRGTEEMTTKSKTLGIKYEKGKEYFWLKDREKELVGGLWNSESCTSSIKKGIWIISIQTYNISTGESYFVIYTQNAIKTYLGEKLNFSYSGENISLIERKEPKYIPEFIDNHLEKEIPMKFEPNIIVITKNKNYCISGLFVSNGINTFPEIEIGKYKFYSIKPNNTYTAKFYFSEWNGEEYVDVLNEKKDFTIENNNIVFFFDEDKKTIKQLQPVTNYAKFKL